MKQNNVAFLWDESFLWGLMAYKALKGLNLPFDLITAENIKTGILDNYEMLFVPGGWASNKSKALGNNGIKAIQDFVENGGNYLGFCGGAGLATKAKGAVGLLNVRRRPTKERVPSFSGGITLHLNPHPMWGKVKEGQIQGTTNEAQQITDTFHAWWPSQFVIEDDTIKVLATYGDALPDSFSADLHVGDVETNGNWSALEKIYQINLDPKRLVHEPAVVEGMYGKGKVMLSLIHFDTPDDIKGQRVLLSLWKYLAGMSKEHGERITENRHNPPVPPVSREGMAANDLFSVADALISVGERNFLWFWRNAMLLQWRRGVRGLEYNTLFIMMREVSEILSNQTSEHRSLNTEKEMNNVKRLLIPFVDQARRLLVLERHAMQKGHITYERCDDPEIQKLRRELFSDSKSHDGMFKELIDEIDNLLFLLIRPP